MHLLQRYFPQEKNSRWTVDLSPVQFFPMPCSLFSAPKRICRHLYLPPSLHSMSFPSDCASGGLLTVPNGPPCVFCAGSSLGFLVSSVSVELGKFQASISSTAFSLSLSLSCFSGDLNHPYTRCPKLFYSSMLLLKNF